jgi:hypothetical protein
MNQLTKAEIISVFHLYHNAPIVTEFSEVPTKDWCIFKTWVKVHPEEKEFYIATNGAKLVLKGIALDDMIFRHTVWIEGVQKSYAMPLYFGANHWANGKNAVELNLAIYEQYL